MKLHFAIDEIKKAIEEIKSGKTARDLYGEKTGKGFWLVGDQGVYLMPNTSDGALAIAKRPKENLFVVYAKECDPIKLEFDTWWENKQESYGGDDGCDFIPLSDIENIVIEVPDIKHIVIDIRPESFTISASMI